MAIRHTAASMLAVLITSGIGACGRWSPAPEAETTTAAAPGEAGCTPVETRDANVPDQRPEFPGQTRACEAKSDVAFEVTVLAKGLERPWAVEPLPDGSLLVTEKPGRLRIVSPDGQLGDPIAGVPDVDSRGQGGLLDVALSPDFATDNTIFWSFTEPRDGGNGTSVARGVLNADRTALEQVQVIFRAMPTYDGDKHYGSRLVFDGDGLLFVTLGERSDTPMRTHAQQFDSHLGKLLRITTDGKAPPDNPFVDRPGAKPEIWTMGHRNVQSAAFDEKGQLWVVEHGTRGGDELNLIQKGRNYGWLADRRLRRGVLGSADRRGGDVARGLRVSHLLLGSGDRPVGRAVLFRQAVPRLARQPVRRRSQGQAAGPSRPREQPCHRRGASADRSRPSRA